MNRALNYLLLYHAVKHSSNCTKKVSTKAKLSHVTIVYVVVTLWATRPTHTGAAVPERGLPSFPFFRFRLSGSVLVTDAAQYPKGARRCSILG